MTYYQTTTSPLVFTTQEAEKVEEWMITAMLELLLKREYEQEDPKQASENINLAMEADSMFLEAPEAPRTEPTPKDVQWWVKEMLWYSEAGRILLSQVGEPLQKSKEETYSEMTLSQYLESLYQPDEHLQ
jgi:hypothetical protein